MDTVFDDDDVTSVTPSVEVDELLKLPEFDTNLPDNTKVIKEAIAKGNPNLITPARIVSLIWLLVHVFIFPHSMYLHEIFQN